MEYDFNYFAERSSEWGDVIEDDKYFTDEELYDNFIAFYCYCFAHQRLPAPSRAQLEIARFVSDREHRNRLVWAMRGLA